jgi:hypothetical protein
MTKGKGKEVGSGNRITNPTKQRTMIKSPPSPSKAGGSLLSPAHDRDDATSMAPSTVSSHKSKMTRVEALEKQNNKESLLISRKDSTRAPRVFYLLLLFGAVVMAMLLKAPQFSGLTQVFVTNLCQQASCVGNQAALRISFALVLFFMTTLIASFFTIYNGKFLVLQVLYFLGLLAIAFVLGQDFYIAYSNMSRFASGLFLMIQLIDLIDFMYKWNDKWVEKDNKWFYGGILAVSAVFIIASIVAWAEFFNFFAQDPTCDLERFFIVFTIILCVGFTVLSISDLAAKGALLPSAALTGYSTFLLFSALRNDPATQCNTGTATDPNNYGQLVIGMVITAGAVTFSGWSLSTGTVFVDTEVEKLKNERKTNAGNKQGELLNEEMTESTAIAYAEEFMMSRTKTVEEINEEIISAIRKSNIFFHVVMLLAGFYSGMLLTNWGVLQDNVNNTISTVGLGTMWVNIVTQWVAIGFYIWTLIAPQLFPQNQG